MTVNISGSGVITFPDGTTQTTAVRAPFRNMIRNGAMQIDQRNTNSSPVTANASSAYTLDGWIVGKNAGGTISTQAYPIAENGFTQCLQSTMTSADGSVSSGTLCTISQRIESLDCFNTSFGSASAKSVTLSFWVNSTVTGTYSASLQNAAGNRSIVANFTISAASTWQYVSLVFSGDVTGTWQTANTSIGITMSIALGAGSTYQTTANTWAAGSYYATSSNSNTFLTTNGAVFQLTGVQLELGQGPSTFEHKPIVVELSRNQRYYQALRVSSGGTVTSDMCPGFGMMTSSTSGKYVAYLQTPMRIGNPTLVYSTLTAYTGSSFSVSGVSLNVANVSSPSYTLTVSGATTGTPFLLTSTSTVALSAEL